MGVALGRTGETSSKKKGLSEEKRGVFARKRQSDCREAEKEEWRKKEEE